MTLKVPQAMKDKELGFHTRLVSACIQNIAPVGRLQDLQPTLQFSYNNQPRANGISTMLQHARLARGNEIGVQTVQHNTNYQTSVLFFPHTSRSHLTQIKTCSQNERGPTRATIKKHTFERDSAAAFIFSPCFFPPFNSQTRVGYFDLFCHFLLYYYGLTLLHSLMTGPRMLLEWLLMQTGLLSYPQGHPTPHSRPRCQLTLPTPPPFECLARRHATSKAPCFE